MTQGAHLQPSLPHAQDPTRGEHGKSQYSGEGEPQGGGEVVRGRMMCERSLQDRLQQFTGFHLHNTNSKIKLIRISTQSIKLQYGLPFENRSLCSCTCTACKSIKLALHTGRGILGSVVLSTHHTLQKPPHHAHCLLPALFSRALSLCIEANKIESYSHSLVIFLQSGRHMHNPYCGIATSISQPPLPLGPVTAGLVSVRWQDIDTSL